VSCDENSTEIDFLSEPSKTTVEQTLTPLPLPEEENEVMIVPSSSSSPSPLPSPSSYPSDLNMISPSQPRLESFPKTLFHTVNRQFNANWYDGRPWLEYSVEKDAVFCFPCRIFGINKTAANYVFTKTGFRNWKTALGGKDRGFGQHANCPFHERNMETWIQQKKRKASGKTMENMVQRMEQDHIKWLEVIFNVVRHLCVNGLPFRGDEECLDFVQGVSGGLFLNTIENLVFQIQPELINIAKKLPHNAKYLSSDIQNEIIEILAELVKEKHAARIRMSELYTIMADGTTDKNHEEIQGVVIRFIDSLTCEIEERALNVGKSGRSAREIFDFVKETLDQSKISFDGLVSQSFDGASVMSGEKGGLQAIICEFCGRNVVYIHCFCHRLHLSIKAVMDEIEELKEHFTLVPALYSFFKLANVRNEYTGDNLKRLIVTRWSGHLRSCKIIQENYHEIVRTLEKAITNKKLKPEDRAKATGFLVQVKSREFIFINFFITDILSRCDIACKILQSSRENLNSAMESISSVREELQEKREEYTAERVDAIITSMRSNLTYVAADDEEKKRPVKRPRRLDDYLITERIPGSKGDNLQRIAIECLDLLEADFSKRFSKKNTELWQAMECLLPTSPHFLNPEKLKPFYKYCLSIPTVGNMLISKSLSETDFEAECRIFKRIISNEDITKFQNNREGIDLSKLCHFMMKRHAETAPVTTMIYRVATTAGFASARVESLFSSLTQIDVPQRRSMSSKRESDLTFLYFEKKTLMSITFPEFLDQWRLKPRKLTF
jgi:hypothetical protein